MMLTSLFDAWWKLYRHLFILEQVKIVRGIDRGLKPYTGHKILFKEFLYYRETVCV